jgi:hypothetical protein
MERDRRTDDGTYPNVGEELRKLKDREAQSAAVGVTTKELEMLLTCALRYALRRQSYVVSEVADVVLRYHAEISEQARKVMICDLKDELERPQLSVIDRSVWQRVLATLGAA